MIVGTTLESGHRLNGYGDTGLGEVVWGNALAGLGLSALFPLFAAQAARHPRHRPSGMLSRCSLASRAQPRRGHTSPSRSST